MLNNFTYRAYRIRYISYGIRVSCYNKINQNLKHFRIISISLYFFFQEQKKLELFEEAARKQTSIMEANILGKGIDNHLLGLREAARETLGELPPVFCDTTYKQMIEFKLSTSQVGS